MYRFPILLSFFLGLSTTASNIPALQGRDAKAINVKRACTNDAVLKALKSNAASATPFCSSFIHVPISTVFKSVPGVTATTIKETITATSTVIPNFPATLPTYVSPYSTSQVSSGCSCLSVPKSTATVTASYSTVYSATTTTLTTTATGVCATGTIYPGAHALTGQFPDAYFFSIYTPSAYECCQICNSGGQGPYASCVEWAYLGGNNCTSILEGAPFADYMKPPCYHDGLQPGTIFVDKLGYPMAVGGKGQCASQVTVVSG